MNTVKSIVAENDVYHKNHRRKHKNKKKNNAVSGYGNPGKKQVVSNDYMDKNCKKSNIESTLNLEKFLQEELQHRYNVTIPLIEENYSEPSDWVKGIIDQKNGNQPVFTTVDLGRLIHQARLWKKYLPRVQPYYAVKSNPDMNIIRTLMILGVNFDCASKGEIEQVLSLGAEPTQIIYANPAKGFEHILYAKEKDVKQMTFDNLAELKKIIQYFPNAELVLRISSNDTMSLLPFGYKFGARRDDAFALIAACAELKANLIGISFHVGSGCYSPVAFIDTLHRAREMFYEAEKHGLKLSLLDIGGGFPGDNEGTITFSEIASAIAPVIDSLFPSDIHVIAEPGRFFCTSTTTVALQIYAKREYLLRRVDPETNEITEIKETQYYCPDGVYGNFNNIIYDHAKPICRPLFEPPLDALMYNSTFFGPTCDSIDVIAKNISFPDMQLGDWIYFNNMGAYTIAAGSCFNGFERPPIYYGILLYKALS
jgi:ornithine decarboxylase